MVWSRIQRPQALSCICELSSLCTRRSNSGDTAGLRLATGMIARLEEGDSTVQTVLKLSFHFPFRIQMLCSDLLELSGFEPYGMVGAIEQKKGYH